MNSIGDWWGDSWGSWVGQEEQEHWQEHSTRDAPRKERKKREWERNGKERFSLFSHSSIFGTLFPFFGRNREKRVKKGAKRWKNGWKDVERGCGAVLALFRFLNLVRFRFLYRLKPIFNPVPISFLPSSNPVFAPFQTRSWPFLYYSSIISRYVPLAAQPLDHIGPLPVCGPLGGWYSWQRDSRD